MKADRYDIRTYPFNGGDNLFFDANVWLYVFGPMGPEDHRSKTYSIAMRRIQEASSNIYTDMIILSEFINRYARIEQGYAGYKDFKDFRGSRDWLSIVKAIVRSCRQILMLSKGVERHIAYSEIGTILDTFQSEASDFNDKVIERTCLNNGLKLVSHDTDFKGACVPILTANRGLLNE